MPTLVDPAQAEWVQFAIISQSWETAFYGFFAAFMLMSSWILVQKGVRNSRARLSLLVINIVMFVMSTAHIVLGIKFYVVQIPTLTAEAEAYNPQWLIDETTRYQTVAMALRRTSYFISDSVVVWRTWCIWNDNIWVRSYLAFLIFATGATSIATGVITGLRIPGMSVIVNLTGTLPLLFTNFCTTLLCGWKVWTYRRFIKSAYGGRRKNTLVENVLLILVESGSLYCVFWVIFLISDFGKLSGGPFGRYWGLEWFMPHFSGIYTCLIILVVALSRTSQETFFSVVDHDLKADISPEREPEKVDTIRFAVPGPQRREVVSFATTDFGSGVVETRRTVKDEEQENLQEGTDASSSTVSSANRV